jgi:hypothetical protein
MHNCKKSSSSPREASVSCQRVHKTQVLRSQRLRLVQLHHVRDNAYGQWFDSRVTTIFLLIFSSNLFIMPNFAMRSNKPFSTLQRRSCEPFLFPAKEVSFASVQVREYPMILGDNPSCTSGPPVTLDWNYNAEASLSCTVDEWESGRDSTRRMRTEIRVPSSVRTEWLLDAGFTPTQVNKAIRDVQKYQRDRWLSIATLWNM